MKMGKLYILILLACVFSINLVLAQEMKEFTAIDLKNIANTIDWSPAKNFKGVSKEKMNLFFLEINNDTALIKQINIDSWGICDYNKIDNLELYNYYYKDISRSFYNNNCKEINALLLIDGIIKQQK